MANAVETGAQEAPDAPKKEVTVDNAGNGSTRKRALLWTALAVAVLGLAWGAYDR